MSEDAREIIQSYADRVEEFTLTDVDGEAKFSPSVLICLARIHVPGRPLFPSLRHLRIDNANTSLDYLHLFLSPSIHTLEIIGVSENRRASLLSFLTVAVEEIPDLTTLILGPGRFSRDVLDKSLEFSQLQRLELLEMAAPLDYQLLKTIGHLRWLKVFSVDGQANLYTCFTTSTPVDPLEEMRIEIEKRIRHAMQLRNEDDDTHRGQEEDLISQQLEREEEEALQREAEELATLTRFKNRTLLREEISKMEDRYRLRVQESVPNDMAFDIDEHEVCEEQPQEHEAFQQKEQDIELLKLFLRKKGRVQKAITEMKERHMHAATRRQEERTRRRIQGHNLREERRRVNEAELRLQFEEEMRTRAEGDLQPNEVAEEYYPLFPTLTTLRICGNSSLVKDLIHLVCSSGLDRISIELSSYPPTSVQASHEPGCPDEQQFVAALDHTLEKWASTLASIDLLANDVPVFSLPKETMRKILHLPELSRLEIRGWNIDSCAAIDFGGRNTPSKLRSLHLPTHLNSLAVPLHQLRIIAEACPELSSIRCNFDSLEGVPSYRYSQTLSHKLKVLAVGNAPPRSETQGPLDVASYLNSLFPDLEQIESCGGTEQDTGQWGYIRDLVKWCQTVRSQERARLIREGFF